MRTIDEYRKEHPQVARERNVDHLRPMAREAVRMDALTGDETWDHFLSYLEGAVKNCAAYRDIELARLRDPMLVNDEAVARCRAAIAQMDTKIATLEEVLRLPKLLKTNAEQAAELIARLSPAKDAAA